MTNEQGQKWVHDLREHGQDDGLFHRRREGRLYRLRTSWQQDSGGTLQSLQEYLRPKNRVHRKISKGAAFYWRAAKETKNE